MSAVLESEEKINPGPGMIDIREGDWKAYLLHIARYENSKDLNDRYGSITDYKRACALAYLGRRAQLHGGVCSTRHPHIMTPHFIADLESSNTTARHTRYPWLKALMNLLSEIEQIQDQVSNTNVISLVSGTKS